MVCLVMSISPCTSAHTAELKLSPFSGQLERKVEEAESESSKSSSTTQSSNQLVPVSSTINGKVIFNANQRPANGYIVFSR